MPHQEKIPNQWIFVIQELIQVLVLGQHLVNGIKTIIELILFNLIV